MLICQKGSEMNMIHWPLMIWHVWYVCCRDGLSYFSFFIIIYLQEKSRQEIDTNSGKSVRVKMSNLTSLSYTMAITEIQRIAGPAPGWLRVSSADCREQCRYVLILTIWNLTTEIGNRVCMGELFAKNEVFLFNLTWFRKCSSSQ